MFSGLREACQGETQHSDHPPPRRVLGPVHAVGPSFMLADGGKNSKIRLVKRVSFSRPKAEIPLRVLDTTMSTRQQPVNQSLQCPQRGTTAESSVNNEETEASDDRSKVSSYIRTSDSDSNSEMNCNARGKRQRESERVCYCPGHCPMGGQCRGALATPVRGCVISMRSICLLYTSPSPRDRQKSRMPSSA